MRLREWMDANRNDEREQAYAFRAGAAGYSILALGVLGLAVMYLAQGRPDDAAGIAGIVGLSQVAFWGLLARWKVAR